jgi:hypothetical protein
MAFMLTTGLLAVTSGTTYAQGNGGQGDDSIWTEQGQQIHNINMNSDVGIGTQTPTQRLDVAGNVRVRDLGGDSAAIVTVDQQGNLQREPIDQPIREVLQPSGQGNTAATALNAWSTKGNEGLDANTDFLGTTDATDLVIRTNDNEKMRVSKTGLVHIQDSLKIGNSIWLGGTDQNTGSNNSIFADNGPLVLQGDNIFNTLISLEEGSFVGIGTAAPQEKLHVSTSHKVGLPASHHGIRLEETKLNQSNTVIGKSTWDVEPIYDTDDSQGRLFLFNKTKSKTVMTLEDTGNVGIGTGDPEQALHIAGQEGPVIKIHDDQGSTHQAWLIGEGLNGGGDLGFKEDDANPGNNIIFDIDGNVGIGTTTPSAKLQVTGAIRVPHQNDASISGEQTLIYNGTSQSGADGQDGFRIRWNPNSSIVNGHSNADGLIFEKTDVNGDDPDGGMAFVNTGQDGTVEPAMVIQGNGQVRVGTESIVSGTHSDYQLAVDGKAVARKFVATHDNWGDDEFNKELTLQDLKEEQQFVEKHQHLQGIPKGKTIQKEGLDLSEMSEQQMRKIEQIYMYLFDFQKENRELKEENKDLQKRLRQLEKEVEKLKEHQ